MPREWLSAWRSRPCPPLERTPVRAFPLRSDQTTSADCGEMSLQPCAPAARTAPFPSPISLVSSRFLIRAAALLVLPLAGCVPEHERGDRPHATAASIARRAYYQDR